MGQITNGLFSGCGITTPLCIGIDMFIFCEVLLCGLCSAANAGYCTYNISRMEGHIVAVNKHLKSMMDAADKTQEKIREILKNHEKLVESLDMKEDELSHVREELEKTDTILNIGSNELFFGKNSGMTPLRKKFLDNIENVIEETKKILKEPSKFAISN